MNSAVASSAAPPKQHVPGESGIWLFVVGDMMMFSLLFAIFLFYRGQDVELFTRSQEHMNQVFGAINTVLMLSSSWFVAIAVQAARQGRMQLTRRLLMAAFLCGAAFGVVKVFEYAEKIRAGIVLTTNDFYMYYFMFTGIHMVHVLLAMGVLAFLTSYLRSATAGGATAGANALRNLESGATFWHLVDLLWIVLFALFYLLK
jgi:nitric oxide reductase NorE protein